jgi:hypothetical protein
MISRSMPSSMSFCASRATPDSELTQLDEQEPEAIERHRDEEVRKKTA